MKTKLTIDQLEAWLSGDVLDGFPAQPTNHRWRSGVGSSKTGRGIDVTRALKAKATRARNARKLRIDTLLANMPDLDSEALFCLAKEVALFDEAKGVELYRASGARLFSDGVRSQWLLNPQMIFRAIDTPGIHEVL